MRRRALALATLSCLALGLHAVAQGTAEQQLDTALRRLRAALPQDTSLEIRERAVDPVTGVASLRGVVLRHDQDVLTIEDLLLRDLREDRVGHAEARGLRLGERSGPQSLVAERLELSGLGLPAAGLPLAWQAVSLDAGSLEGVTLTLAAAVGGGRLQRLTLRDWGPGRAAAAGLEALALGIRLPERGVLDVGLGRMALAGVEGPAMLAALTEGIVPPLRPGATAQSAEAGDLTIGMDGQPVLAVGALRLAGGADPARADAESAALVLSGVALDPPPDATGQRPEWLGFKRLLGGLSLDARAEENGRRLELAPLRIEVAEAGRLTLSAGFTDLPPRDATQPLDPQARVLAMQAARLTALRITYEDAGLAPGLFAEQARQAGMSAAAYQEGLAAMVLTTPLPGAPPQPPRKSGAPAGAPDVAPEEQAVREALAGFLRRPGTLELALDPPRPMRLDEMAPLAMLSPDGPVRALGLTAEAR